jgi:hypothetical protein
MGSLKENLFTDDSSMHAPRLHGRNTILLTYQDWPHPSRRCDTHAFGAAVQRLCASELSMERIKAAAGDLRELPLGGTAAHPEGGQDRAESLAGNQRIRELVRQEELLPRSELERILDPWRMTEPGLPK